MWDEAPSVGRAVYRLATSGAASIFVVCSGDLQFEVAVDEEWLIDKLSDDGCKMNLSTNLFHRKLSNETCITLYLYCFK